MYWKRTYRSFPSGIFLFPIDPLRLHTAEMKIHFLFRRFFVFISLYFILPSATTCYVRINSNALFLIIDGVCASLESENKKKYFSGNFPFIAIRAGRSGGSPLMHTFSEIIFFPSVLEKPRFIMEKAQRIVANELPIRSCEPRLQIID